jgi:hypothetical protein
MPTLRTHSLYKNKQMQLEICTTHPTYWTYIQHNRPIYKNHTHRGKEATN